MNIPTRNPFTPPHGQFSRLAALNPLLHEEHVDEFVNVDGVEPSRREFIELLGSISPTSELRLVSSSGIPLSGKTSLLRLFMRETRIHASTQDAGVKVRCYDFHDEVLYPSAMPASDKLGRVASALLRTLRNENLLNDTGEDRVRSQEDAVAQFGTLASLIPKGQLICLLLPKCETEADWGLFLDSLRPPLLGFAEMPDSVWARVQTKARKLPHLTRNFELGPVDRIDISTFVHRRLETVPGLAISDETLKSFADDRLKGIPVSVGELRTVFEIAAKLAIDRGCTEVDFTEIGRAYIHTQSRGLV